MSGYQGIDYERLSMVVEKAMTGCLVRELLNRASKRTVGSSLSFGQAITALRMGLKVQRSGWNGKGLWLELQIPDEHSKMTLPYIYINYPGDSDNTPGARVPWLASQTDMLTDDWRIV